jgi:hypothetical protein
MPWRPQLLLPLLLVSILLVLLLVLLMALPAPKKDGSAGA